MCPGLKLCWIMAAISVPLTCWAQDNDESRVRVSIRRGVSFLKSRQSQDGSWQYGGHELGMTALAGLALAENGVPPEDKSLQSALSFVRGTAPASTTTYDISLAILFLARMNDKSDLELILQLGARLMAGQLTSGGWTYSCPMLSQPPPSMRNSPNPGSSGRGTVGGDARRAGRLNAGSGRTGYGDNSNTQFAVLGVWAAGRAGLDVSDTMDQVDRRFRSTQATTGGWGYAGGGDTDSMTCAGLMSLALAKGQKVLSGRMTNRKSDDAASEDPGGRPKMNSDSNIERGMKRVEAYAGGIGPASTLYFLWSVERVGVALGLNRLGNVDWYRRGSSVMLQSQQSDGSWRSNRGDLPDTSFALLFLHRSNLAEGMPQLITGRSGGADENRMRAGNLNDLIRSVRPDAKPDK